MLAPNRAAGPVEAGIRNRVQPMCTSCRANGELTALAVGVDVASQTPESPHGSGEFGQRRD